MRRLIYNQAICLVLVEINALEVNDNKTLLGVVEELSYSELAVLNIFLLHEARLLEELVEAAVGDVLDHSLGEIGSLGLRGGLDDFAALGSVFFGDPAL